MPERICELVRPHAEAETKQQLVSIIEQATDEAEVTSWMASNKVPRAELGARHVDGSTAIISACRRGMAEVAKSLLAVNAPVQDVNDIGDSALHWASLKAAEVDGMVDVVEQLLSAGADPSAVGDCGNTPLHLAAASRSPLVRRHIVSTKAVDCIVSAGCLPTITAACQLIIHLLTAS